MALKKSDIAKPSLPMEAVEVPELGGEVIVRGLLLSERLDLVLHEDEGIARIPRMLSTCVIDADHKAIFTADEWETYGARHAASALKLWEVAKRLSGMDREDTEKN